MHLGAQLPMLLRGLYYEGWHMAGKPTKDRSAQGLRTMFWRSCRPSSPSIP